MKNSMFKALSSLVLFTAMSSAFAFSSDCPPGNQVKTMKLTQASWQGYPTAHTWDLVSDTFKYGYRDWNVYLIVDLPNAKTRSDAVKMGQAVFDQASISVNVPVPQNSDGMSYCNYTPDKKYHITAISAVEDGFKDSLIPR